MIATGSGGGGDPPWKEMCREYLEKPERMPYQFEKMLIKAHPRLKQRLVPLLDKRLSKEKSSYLNRLLSIFGADSINYEKIFDQTVDSYSKTLDKQLGKMAEHLDYAKEEFKSGRSNYFSLLKKIDENTMLYKKNENRTNDLEEQIHEYDSARKEYLKKDGDLGNLYDNTIESIKGLKIELGHAYDTIESLSEKLGDSKSRLDALLTINSEAKRNYDYARGLYRQLEKTRVDLSDLMKSNQKRKRLLYQLQKFQREFDSDCQYQYHTP